MSERISYILVLAFVAATITAKDTTTAASTAATTTATDANTTTTTTHSTSGYFICSVGDIIRLSEAVPDINAEICHVRIRLPLAILTCCCSRDEYISCDSATTTA